MAVATPSAQVKLLTVLRAKPLIKQASSSAIRSPQLLVSDGAPDMPELKYLTEITVRVLGQLVLRAVYIAPERDGELVTQHAGRALQNSADDPKRRAAGIGVEAQDVACAPARAQSPVTAE